MHAYDVSATKPAYGLEFAVADLVLLRRWAEHRQLRLTITLDSMIDGAEVEELLVLTPANSSRHILMLWRTQDGIYAQAPDATPQGFATMRDLLDRVRPARPRKAAWLRRLGLA